MVRSWQSPRQASAVLAAGARRAGNIRQVNHTGMAVGAELEYPMSRMDSATGWGFSLSDFDPTNKKGAFSDYSRMAANLIPGGGAAMTAIDVANKIKEQQAQADRQKKIDSDKLVLMRW